MPIDTHAHAFTTDLPLVADARYRPQTSRPIAAYLRVLDAHEIDRAVLVQPSFLGIDNSYILAAIRAHPQRLRGVAVVEPDAEPAALDALAAAGIAGLRLNVIESMGPWALDARLQQLAEAAAQRGMHIELHASAERLAMLIAFLLPTGVQIVIDHFGRPGPEGADDPGFRAIRAAAPSRRVWVKLSGPYRVAYPDRAALATILLSELGADRLVWGSDWPWTQNEDGRSYAALLTDLKTWVPDAAARAQILTRSAEALFGFRSGA